ncbi:hypothetical protein AAHN97_14965 [Chitinophaga niabensis]|uniref:hypothetical protein n=1 Tax=Chitinophaga niabensis TaxID=536979 RepID=UPI0031BA24CB
MITLNIMRGEVQVESIKPGNNSSQSKTIMGDNQLSIQFELSRLMDLRIGDWCEVFGERYYINQLPKISKGSSREYAYDMVMQADYFGLAKTMFMFYDENNELKEGVFSLMGKPEVFIDLIVKNANRVGAGWTRGAVIIADAQNMTFNSESCLEVLGRIAQQFGTEYFIEGKKVSLDRKLRDRGVTLSVGKGKGLYDLGRDPLNDTNVVTRLYAFGSEKNLPPDYRNYSRRLKMTGGEVYLEKNVGTYGLNEQTTVFENIYPHRTGKVTNVNALNPNVFFDSTMDFDVNDFLLPGVAAKVTFNTGQLAGYTFDIKAGGYNNITKQFTVLKNKNEKAIDVPSSLFRPAIGDEYVLVDIQMPPSYVTAAEAELTAAAQKLLDTISVPQFTNPISVDPAYFRKNNLQVDIGDLIWIVDTPLSINRRIRVTAFTRTFEDEFNYQLTLSDGLSINAGSEIYNLIGNNGRSIDEINSQLNNRASENDFIGPVTMADLPTTTDITGMFPLYVDATGKVYKKI